MAKTYIRSKTEQIHFAENATLLISHRFFSYGLKKLMTEKKTIESLDINKIDENHLITLEIGDEMFRRVLGNPLEFHYNDTTFTEGRDSF